MEDFFKYIIDNPANIKISENSLLIDDEGLQLQITFSRRIENIPDFSDSSENQAQSIRLKQYTASNKDFTKRLYSTIIEFYAQTGRIPSYSIGGHLDVTDNLFYEIYAALQSSSEFCSIQSAVFNTGQPFLDIPAPAVIDYVSVPDAAINILQSNTKTRRLGYLKLIIKLFQNSNYFPITYLSRKIESESSLYARDLLEYGREKGDDKGLIKQTPNGASAQPYIDLLEELNLTTKVNSAYILTKQSKVYFNLNKYFTEKNYTDGNIFQLDLLDKLFFLRQILISDSLYLWSIIDIIFIAGKSLTTMDIKKVFTEYIKNELDLNQQYSKSNITKKQIIALKSRISSWKKPLVYLEHIIEPRINWLVDLGILQLNSDSKEKQYFFTSEGLNLVSTLIKVFGKNLNKQLVLKSFLEKNYLHVFNYIFGLNKKRATVHDIKVEQYFIEAFKIFKTEAPNKIAASQAIDYVCFKLFLVDDLIIEFEELKKYLQISNEKFSMDWFKTENDGALYLKK